MGNYELTEIDQKKKKRDVLFITGDWNAKVGSQEILGITGKFGLGIQNEAGQRWKEFGQENFTGHTKYTLPTTQEITLHMDIFRWSVQNQIGYTFCSRRLRSSIVSKNKTRS